jgi:hypothetical protein
MEPTLQLTRSDEDEAGLTASTGDSEVLYSNRSQKAVLGCFFGLCALVALSRVGRDTPASGIVAWGLVATATLYLFARCFGASFTVARDDEAVTVTRLLSSQTILLGNVRAFRSVTLRVGASNRRCLVVINADGSVDELHRMVHARADASAIDEIAQTLNTARPSWRAR